MTMLTPRPGARTLVLDPRGRVLLFGAVEPSGRRFWFTPGGGSEPGETPEQTALRELREETGFSGITLGPEVWRRRFIAEMSGLTYDCRERCFLVRMPESAIDTSGFTDLERTTIVAARWWTLDELAATTDCLAPRGLVQIVREIEDRGVPRQPWLLNRDGLVGTLDDDSQWW